MKSNWFQIFTVLCTLWHLAGISESRSVAASLCLAQFVRLSVCRSFCHLIDCRLTAESSGRNADKDRIKTMWAVPELSHGLYRRATGPWRILCSTHLYGSVNVWKRCWENACTQKDKHTHTRRRGCALWAPAQRDVTCEQLLLYSFPAGIFQPSISIGRPARESVRAREMRRAHV